MPEPFVPLKTLPQIARELGVTTRQAQHAADVYRVEPLTRIANARLFDAEGVERLRSALVRTGALAPASRKAGAR